jgi:hypothetical protein
MAKTTTFPGLVLIFEYRVKISTNEFHNMAVAFRTKWATD